MKVMIDLCVVPIGVGVSVSKHVALCQKVIREAGFEPHLHAYGTGIEGEWDQVMAAVKRCFEELHDNGVPRVHATMRLGTRTDKDQTLDQKVESVALRLKGDQRQD
jgi:uncharacterized protein (TIGR00106 family)